MRLIVLVISVLALFSLAVSSWAGGAECGDKTMGMEKEGEAMSAMPEKAETMMGLEKEKGEAMAEEAKTMGMEEKKSEVIPAMPAKAQTMCPVMEGPVNKEVYCDYKGHRVYFCCKACKAKFEAEPEQYMKKMESEGVELEKAP